MDAKPVYVKPSALGRWSMPVEVAKRIIEDGKYNLFYAQAVKVVEIGKPYWINA